MRSTIALRLALAALGFALGLGVALAARWRPPPDLSKNVCPDCRNPVGVVVQYQPADDTPGKLIATAQYGQILGTFDADPTVAYPSPLSGPRFCCPRCQAAWGPPAYHKKGHPRRRY